MNTRILHQSEIENKKRLWINILLGLFCSCFYFFWWFKEGRIQHPVFFTIFLFALLYFIVQVLFSWFIFLQIKLPKFKKAKTGLSVDVFIPTYDEPLWLVERTLSAAANINYPHKTYLIDDSHSKAYYQLAQTLGVNYISRGGNKDYKAGNINAALKQTNSDFVAIFDVDHIPEQDFLDRSLGYFDDPKIGFVQVLLNHYNHTESYIAAGGSRRNDSFFGPSMLGLNGCDCVQAFGSNCIFRRKALESIGGYKPGLAEDINTSLNLHAKGWKSAYVPEVLAKGLEPSNISGFFKQQLKWSKGIFSTLFTVYPKFIRRLSWKTNIGYLWRLTCYLAGPAIAAHISFLALVLFGGSKVWDAHLANYLKHWLPLVLIFSYINYSAETKYSPAISKNKYPLSGLFMAFGSWATYTFSFICTVLSINVPFIPTPKEANGSLSVKLIVPQIVTIIVLVIGIILKLNHSLTIHSMVVCIFALLIIFLHSGLLYAAWEEWHLIQEKKVRYSAVNSPV